MRPKICVFAGSAQPTDPSIITAARQLGTQLAAAGYDLVYGGGVRGVMGEVAAAAQAGGSEVTAIIFKQYAGEPQLTTNIVEVDTEIERFQAFLAQRPAANFLLPGGPGSLREAMQGLEAAIYEQGPPVVLVKVGPYLNGIKSYFNHAVAGGLIKAEHRDALRVWKPGSALSVVIPTAAQGVPPQPNP